MCGADVTNKRNDQKAKDNGKEKAVEWLVLLILLFLCFVNETKEKKKGSNNLCVKVYWFFFWNDCHTYCYNVIIKDKKITLDFSPISFSLVSSLDRKILENFLTCRRDTVCAHAV